MYYMYSPSSLCFFACDGEVSVSGSALGHFFPIGAFPFPEGVSWMDFIVGSQSGEGTTVLS